MIIVDLEKTHTKYLIKYTLVSLIHQSRVGPFKKLHSCKSRLVVVSVRVYWSHRLKMVDWFVRGSDPWKRDNLLSDTSLRWTGNILASSYSKLVDRRCLVGILLIKAVMSPFHIVGCSCWLTEYCPRVKGVCLVVDSCHWYVLY
jgi:hypothetical protein